MDLSCPTSDSARFPCFVFPAISTAGDIFCTVIEAAYSGTYVTGGREANPYRKSAQKRGGAVGRLNTLPEK
jgi:hypothetical protein